MEMSPVGVTVVKQRSVEQRRKHARSRVSNGRNVLPDVDGRTAIARRYKDISKAILTDQGGADRCSESRKQLIRRFAAAVVLAEQMESRLANGEQIDIQRHATLSSTLVRLAQRIGIDRVPRDVSPSLADYLEAGAAGEAVEAGTQADGHPDSPDSNERTGYAPKPIAGRTSECNS